jgi:hypothetical protein
MFEKKRHFLKIFTHILPFFSLYKGEREIFFYCGYSIAVKKRKNGRAMTTAGNSGKETPEGNKIITSITVWAMNPVGASDLVSKSNA